MALPTANLTAHFDASDTDKLWTTWVNGGPHTGTPADTGTVQSWGRETDGSVTPLNWAYQGGVAPAYVSTSSPMLLPCMHFTEEYMAAVTDTSVVSYYSQSSFFTTTAKHLFISFRAAAIDATSADHFSCEGLIGFYDAFGVWMRNNGGQRQLRIAAKDTGWCETTPINISLNTDYVLQVWHDGTNLKGRLDEGSEVSVACGTSSTGWPAPELRVGRAGGSIEAKDAYVGEVALYNAVLSGTDQSDALAYFRLKWQGVGGSPDGEEALAGSAITPGHGTSTPDISISI
jgi:hypothetical protein